MFDAPFNDTISALSGFVITIDIPFAVSMLDPPPTATITSAPDFLQASIPSVTFFIVGFGFTSEYTSKGIPAFSKTSVTLLITPHSANDLSVTTNAFLNPLPDAVLCARRGAGTRCGRACVNGKDHSETGPHDGRAKNVAERAGRARRHLQRESVQDQEQQGDGDPLLHARGDL